MNVASDPIKIFDRRSLWLHRRRAAPLFHRYDFLHREVADHIRDRLQDISRPFSRALDIGGRAGTLPAGPVIRTSQHAGINQAADAIMDEELIAFAPETFDLVASVLSLHWVNDLPGCLLQIRRILKPDGLFIGAMLGGETLRELRQSLQEAELEIEGGVSPRLSPFADVRDLGGLLQRAGFALPVTDSDRVTVSYSDPFALMKELRGMGETNAVRDRKKTFSRRQTFLRAAEIYQDRFGDGEGRVPATFQVIYLTGWAPAPSQPQPLKPGSARTSLTAVLGKKKQ